MFRNNSAVAQSPNAASQSDWVTKRIHKLIGKVVVVLENQFIPSFYSWKRTSTLHEVELKRAISGPDAAMDQGAKEASD